MMSPAAIRKGLRTHLNKWHYRMAIGDSLLCIDYVEDTKLCFTSPLYFFSCIVIVNVVVAITAVVVLTSVKVTLGSFSARFNH